MKVTIDTGGMVYEFTEPEGWFGELTAWDKEMLKMTLKHVLFTLGPAMRDMPPMPPKGRLT